MQYAATHQTSEVFVRKPFPICHYSVNTKMIWQLNFFGHICIRQTIWKWLKKQVVLVSDVTAGKARTMPYLKILCSGHCSAEFLSCMLAI